MPSQALREERVNFDLRIFSNRQAGWLLFFGSILAAWAVLFILQAGSTDPAQEAGALWQGTPFQALVELCQTSVADSGFPSVFAMWALMSLAMMAPTSLPALKTYSDLPDAARLGSAGFAALFGGYLTVWFAFSALAAAAQIALAKANLLDAEGRNLLPVMNAFLLALAGAYQFSALKEACLNSCRSPLMFFMANWREGLSGSALMGLKLGAICLGCCWTLMLLAFVAGTMNLAFMGLATLLMVLEKLPQIGNRISTPLGIALLAAAALTLFIEYGLLT